MKTFRFQTIQLTSVYVYIITVLCIKSTFVFRLKIGILQLTFENVCINKHIMNSHRLWEWLVGGGGRFNPHFMSSTPIVALVYLGVSDVTQQITKRTPLPIAIPSARSASRF